jgi:hypothetical protein
MKYYQRPSQGLTSVAGLIKGNIEEIELKEKDMEKATSEMMTTGENYQKPSHLKSEINSIWYNLL